MRPAVDVTARLLDFCSAATPPYTWQLVVSQICQARFGCCARAHAAYARAATAWARSACCDHDAGISYGTTPWTYWSRLSTLTVSRAFDPGEACTLRNAPR